MQQTLITCTAIQLHSKNICGGITCSLNYPYLTVSCIVETAITDDFLSTVGRSWQELHCEVVLH